MGTALPLLAEGKILYAAGTAGYAGGEPQGLPWPASSLIFADGNKWGKPWVLDEHRPFSDTGYLFGFTYRGHFKAVMVRFAVL